MMQAAILAAGFGSRLRPLTDDRPKALIPLAGQPIIGHALEALAEAGVDSVVIVAGYARAALVEYLGARKRPAVTVVDNPAYATTNTLASLLCAAPMLAGDFLLLDGDLVFDRAVLPALIAPGTRLAIDRARPLDDDAVKVALDGNRIVSVGKTLAPQWTPVAESIGIAKIDAATAGRLCSVGRRLLAAGAAQAYYEAAFQELIEAGAVFAPADITGRNWVEIDDHDDLARAESLFIAA